MTPPPPTDAIRPPEPDSAPASTSGLRRPASMAGMAGGAQALVRVTQPDLMRRAILDKSRGRLVIAAFGFSGIFGVVAIKLALATR